MKKAAKKTAKKAAKKEINTYDIYGEPTKHPRVGKEFQAEIPPLMSNNEYLGPLIPYLPCSNGSKELVISGQNKGCSEKAICLVSEKTHTSLRRSPRLLQLSTQVMLAIAYENVEEDFNKLKRKRYPRRAKRS